MLVVIVGGTVKVSVVTMSPASVVGGSVVCSVLVSAVIVVVTVVIVVVSSVVTISVVAIVCSCCRIVFCFACGDSSYRCYCGCRCSSGRFSCSCCGARLFCQDDKGETVFVCVGFG